MKVKVVITKEQEMEIENSASLAVLHKWWKTHPATDWKDCPNELVKRQLKKSKKLLGCLLGAMMFPKLSAQFLLEIMMPFQNGKSEFLKKVLTR